MIPVRVIPCLLLKGRGLVKTVKFKDPVYVGDPRNAVKIFNEKEVDELIMLDITATLENRGPPFELMREIVSEAFMPVAYGGGIRSIQDARAMLSLGVEKIVVCTNAVENPRFVTEAAEVFGSQSLIVCLDVKRNQWGKYELRTHGGRKNTYLGPAAFAKRMERIGAGEVVVNSIDHDGTMAGYDIGLVRLVTQAVNVPVIACGGAGKDEDFRAVVREGGASAVAAGSMFVFQGRHRAVLINYPEQAVLKELFSF